MTRLHRLRVEHKEQKQQKVNSIQRSLCRRAAAHLSPLSAAFCGPRCSRCYRRWSLLLLVQLPAGPAPETDNKYKQSPFGMSGHRHSVIKSLIHANR